MENSTFTKSMVLDYLWQYSRFYSQRLFECEQCYSEEKGYAAITLLFSCLENICKSATDDYESSFYDVVKKLKENLAISEVEYRFLNQGEFCIRKIRNLFAHANISAINLVNQESNKDILYPLTEEVSCMLLYERVSDIIFNLILKIISLQLVDEIREKTQINLDSDIDKCKLEFKILTSKEMLTLKGFPEDYISDDLGIPEHARIRIIENAPDVNIYKKVFDSLLEN